jgi:histidyl-tRNA synthetase
MKTPSVPKGMRDILPKQMARRQYLFRTIEEGFREAGFLPIETPSMEQLSTLMGKYGEEGDRLIFKVLNSGDFLKKVRNEDLSQAESLKVAPKIAEKALRYDLTVPFARFVVEHQNEIPFPFKRYQIQPVWRADRPQKGRYREFWQCDADTIGSDSLWNEVELLRIFDRTLTRLGIPRFSIRVNDRRILAGVAEIMGERERFAELTVAIDKLDKIGEEGVKEELKERGFDVANAETLEALFRASDPEQEDQLEAIEKLMQASEEGKRGVEALRFIFDRCRKLANGNARFIFDPTLARGLDYYTGGIFEVTVDDLDMGSIGGGGRYDDLTGIFGMEGVSGVGISFGAERIYDVLEELDLFPAEAGDKVDVLFANFGEEATVESMRLADELREDGFTVDIYPDASKLKKQMKYADRRGARFVAMIGEEELKNEKVAVRDMRTGEQSEVPREGLRELLDQERKTYG